MILTIRNSGHPEADHFEDILDMVEIGSASARSRMSSQGRRTPQNSTTHDIINTYD